MKIALICIGPTRDKNLIAAIEKYRTRIPFYNPFETIYIPDVKVAKDAERQKKAEGEKILSQLRTGDYLCLLDERGKEMTSREFAGWIEKINVGQQATSRLVFAVGGPYGFSEDVYQRANAKLSLSKMTLPHELVRLFFVEQLYRAMTIMRNEPYHHD